MISKKVLTNIRNDLLELSSLELQLDKWIFGNSGRESSYTELMCRLFDDDALDEFIDKDVYELRFSDSFIEDLKNLRHLLNEFDDVGLSSLEIVRSSQWREIINKAKLITSSGEFDQKLSALDD